MVKIKMVNWWNVPFGNTRRHGWWLAHQRCAVTTEAPAKAQQYPAKCLHQQSRFGMQKAMQDPAARALAQTKHALSMQARFVWGYSLGVSPNRKGSKRWEVFTRKYKKKENLPDLCVGADGLALSWAVFLGPVDSLGRKGVDTPYPISPKFWEASLAVSTPIYATKWKALEKTLKSSLKSSWQALQDVSKEKTFRKKQIVEK